MVLGRFLVDLFETTKWEKSKAGKNSTRPVRRTPSNKRFYFSLERDGFPPTFET